MPRNPQPASLRPIMPPELPPTAPPFITRLEEPDVPPSLENIIDSNRLINQIKSHISLNENPTLTKDRLGKTLVHRHRLLAAHTASHPEQMPAWARLMEQRLQQNADSNKNEVTALITGVDKKVEALSKRVVNIEILAARTHNLSCDDGKDHAYVRIASPTGCFPNEDGFGRNNYQLPPLCCADDIQNLSDVHLNAYIQGYDIPYRRNASREQKLKKLRYYVGSRGAL